MVYGLCPMHPGGCTTLHCGVLHCYLTLHCGPSASAQVRNKNLHVHDVLLKHVKMFHPDFPIAACLPITSVKTGHLKGSKNKKGCRQG